MKKISYFGKEYAVGDSAKWVATRPNGSVFSFIEEPQILWNTWATVSAGAHVGLSTIGVTHWKNSLRKVEDILVRESTPATSSHPHADLMLKCAMIAQYDDKPWECFECDVGGGGWVGMIGSLFHEGYSYRLKPQEPKIQVGQVWVSKEGVDIEVTGYKDLTIVTTVHALGGNKIYWAFGYNEFLQNFKLNE